MPLICILGPAVFFTLFRNKLHIVIEDGFFFSFYDSPIPFIDFIPKFIRGGYMLGLLEKEEGVINQLFESVYLGIDGRCRYLFLPMGSVYLASLGFSYPLVVVYSIANVEGYCVAVPLNPISEFGIGLAFLLIQEEGSCSFDVHMLFHIKNKKIKIPY